MAWKRSNTLKNVKPYTIPIVLQDGTKPVNGRIFTDECLLKMAEQLKDQKLYGEKIPYISSDRNKIDFNNIAVFYEDIHYQDNKLVANATILDPLIQEMMELKIPFTYGIRAFVRTNENDEIIPDTVKVLTYDITLKGEHD